MRRPWYLKSDFDGFQANFLEIASRELHKYQRFNNVMPLSSFVGMFGLLPKTVKAIHFVYL